MLVRRPKATINPLNFRTSYLYDSDGRQHVVIDPLLRRNTTVFDKVGQVLAIANHTTVVCNLR